MYPKGCQHIKKDPDPGPLWVFNFVHVQILGSEGSKKSLKIWWVYVE